MCCAVFRHAGGAVKGRDDGPAFALEQLDREGRVHGVVFHDEHAAGRGARLGRVRRRWLLDVGRHEGWKLM